MTTKKLKGVLYLTLGCIAYFAVESCKKQFNKEKEDNLDLSTKSSSNKELIEQAKIFFENATNSTTHDRKTTNSYINPLERFAKTVKWDSAYVRLVSTGNAVIVPMEYRENVFIKVGDRKIGLQTITKTFIKKDRSGEMKVEVVRFIPDQKYLSSTDPVKAFSGIINVTDWQGNFVKAYLYSNGKGRRISAPESHKGSFDSSKSANSKKTLSGTCTLYWWGWCDHAGDSYTDCEVTDYDLYCPPPDHEEDNEDDAGDYPGGAPGPVPNVPNTPQEVQNHFSDPCDSLVLAKLMNVNLTGNIANVIQNVFATSTTAHLTFNEFSDPSPSARPAMSIVASGSTSSNFNVTISLNTAKMGNSTQEFRATIMIHESIHAFMNMNNQYYENQLRQHQLMAENYVEYMRVLIQSIYPMNNENAYSLVLNGLSDAFGNSKPAYLSTLNNKYHVSNPLHLYEYHRNSFNNVGTNCPTN